MLANRDIDRYIWEYGHEPDFDDDYEHICDKCDSELPEKPSYFTPVSETESEPVFICAECGYHNS